MIDVTQAPHERLRDELALLVRTARPVVGVLNFTAEPRNHETAWRQLLRREAVHSQVAFDVMVNDTEAETALFSALDAVVASSGRRKLARLLEAQRGARTRSRLESLRAASELLLDLALLRVRLPRDAPNTSDRQLTCQLEEQATSRERAGLLAIARARGFDGHELAADAPPAVAELLEARLLDPATLKRHGPGLLTLTAGGAAVGGTADLFVGGASFGLGALVGGVVGLAGGLLRTSIAVRKRGEWLEARLDPVLAWVALARVLACDTAYHERTHARRDTMRLEAEGTRQRLERRPEARALVKLLNRLADDPELTGDERDSPRRRAEALLEVEQRLSALWG